MKQLLAILILIATIISSANGQVSRTDLEGEWQTNNKDSLYYKSDTIEFIQDMNHSYVNSCDIVVLRVSQPDFKFINFFLCTEPGRERWTNGEQSIDIKKGKDKDTLEIRTPNRTERFTVLNYEEKRVDRYPWDIKILKLKRL
jgi:hypothetical protein